MKTTLTVDWSRTCRRCYRPGACTNGYCPPCNVQRVQERRGDLPMWPGNPCENFGGSADEQDTSLSTAGRAGIAEATPVQVRPGPAGADSLWQQGKSIAQTHAVAMGFGDMPGVRE